MACSHESILLDVSSSGMKSGFRQPKKAVLAAEGGLHPASIYPAPLVFPEDLLTYPEENEPQSYSEFVDEEERNEITQKRRTIYLVKPEIDKSVAYLRLKPGPKLEHVREYVAAFFHPLPVKLYDGPMRYVKGRGKSIDMLFGDQLLDVRSRPSPNGIQRLQLNLNDLLDVLINLLPEDAYAMMMLVDHDIYEEEEDDFVCGRAYGGSRVGVVSTARYNPTTDRNIDLQHAWPASHCQAYADQCTEMKPKKRKVEAAPSAMRDAIAAFANSRGDNYHLWLSRVCKTATHELGHCFGMDHCCYYACLMQGTCGLAEDARQPPYLCPVDERKLSTATGNANRDGAMMQLLRKDEWQSEPMFAAFGAWLQRKSQMTT